MKKALTIVLSALILTSAIAGAHALTSAYAEYEGFGIVELDLNQNVRWTEPVVTVTDPNGDTFEAQVLKYDRDDVDFWVPNVVEDQVYACNVSGIEGGETITCEFYASSLRSTMIRSVDYDAEDRELDIEFAVDVTYDTPSVTVIDANGTLYETKILERDNDSLEVRVKGLSRGSAYTVSVSGVKARNMDTFETYSLEFVARDD